MFEIGSMKFVWFREWFIEETRVKAHSVLVSKKVRGPKPLGTNSLKVTEFAR